MTATNRDSNPGIPNPGIGDSLIPGFRDYENEQNTRILHDISPKKYFLPEFWGQFPVLKLRVNGLDPNTHRFTGAIVLNKPLVRLRTLLYSIRLDS